MESTTLSFIIPAYNESSIIEAAIHNIREFAPHGIQYELIVVDNGSTDHTLEVARKFLGDQAISTKKSVGGARNSGVAVATGSVLVFLDADVRLTASWKVGIGRYLDALSTHKELLVGSTVSVPEHASLVEKVWFLPASGAPRTYINSGHLIVRRDFFFEIGGFDEGLQTGEDVDFCTRARLAGAKVQLAPELQAVHLGFPTTLRAFAKRELWHGRGDARNLSSILRSKVALTSLLFVMMLPSGAIMALWVGRVVPLAIAAVFTVMLCLYFGLRRARGAGMSSVIACSVMYGIYFSSRAASLFVAQAGWRQGATRF